MVKFNQVQVLSTLAMKILFVQPSLGIKFSSIRKKFLYKVLQSIEADEFHYLHLSVYYIAAITPCKHSIKIIDERFKKVDFKENCDLVVITCSTPFAPRAYELSDEFRKGGKTVVLAGPHPTLFPDEALQHADSIIIGEVDVSWINLLEDVEAGNLKSIYRNKRPSLSDIKKSKREIPGFFFMPTRIETSRGCPNACLFCLVPVIEGKTHRVRDIEDVLEEIKRTKNRFINFDDPSLTINPEYTKDLFRRMRRLKKKFFCCGNADVLSVDDELLKLAKDAGCIAWFVGFESFNPKSLKESGKKTNDVSRYETVVKKIHGHGMAVIGSFIFGFDSDTIDTFDFTLEMVNKIGLDSVTFNILGVYPNTPLFKKLKEEGRIITEDWSDYNFCKATYIPRQMRADELEKGTLRVAMEFYSWKNILKRSLFALRLGMYPFFFITIRNIMFRWFYKSWEKCCRSSSGD